MRPPTYTSKKITPQKSHVSSSSDIKHNKFNTAHVNLLTSGLYLGNNHFKIDDVTWQQIGFNTCLITKESAIARNASNTMLGEMASAEDTTQTVTGDYELAVLLAIIQISDQDFWMMPDGNWRGPNQYCPTFADLKLTCTGKTLTSTPFEEDFMTVLTNVTTLMNLSARFGMQRGLFIKQPPERKIKFCHVLFKIGDFIHETFTYHSNDKYKLPKTNSTSSETASETDGKSI